MSLPTKSTTEVDNAIYEGFGERWYRGSDHPLALLRAQTAPLASWIADEASRCPTGRSARVLDLGCGGGLISNALAERGLQLTGIDASQSSLAVAARHDRTGDVCYQLGDARALDFPDASFDIVTAMDFLEHVDQPEQVIREAARVLVPNGRFLFHTFNRNVLAWLVVIKGVEWFVQNTPPRMHVLELFLKPGEVRKMCSNHGLTLGHLRGFGPKVRSRAFFRLLATGSVPSDLSFGFQRSTLTSYVGVSVKAG
jgi:2-polyprenyl-6-hydroxyphenyl methylase / 3-demethylubiquinone-9 3-methyltransferase